MQLFESDQKFSICKFRRSTITFGERDEDAGVAAEEVWFKCQRTGIREQTVKRRDRFILVLFSMRLKVKTFLSKFCFMDRNE